MSQIDTKKYPGSVIASGVLFAYAGNHFFILDVFLVALGVAFLTTFLTAFWAGFLTVLAFIVLAAAGLAGFFDFSILAGCFVAGLFVS